MAASSRTTPAAERALRASDVRAAYAVLDAGALDDLLLFRRLKKWTVPCFAEYWNASEDVARRALRRLHAAGVVSCLQGRIYGDGGRESDLYFLSRLGARVLTRHLGLGPNADIRAPTVALDGGEVTCGGLVKHKRPAKPGQDAHDLACLRLALHFDWLSGDRGWQAREALRYEAGADRHRAVLVPDFFRLTKRSLWCVEVEGTTEAQHIRMKHRRYRALFDDLARRGEYGFSRHLTLVFTGVAVREKVLRVHEKAYVTQGWEYGLSWADLDTALAADWERGLGSLCTDVDYQAVRDWWREHYDRQLRALGW